MVLPLLHELNESAVFAHETFTQSPIIKIKVYMRAIDHINLTKYSFMIVIQDCNLYAERVACDIDR